MTATRIRRLFYQHGCPQAVAVPLSEIKQAVEAPTSEKVNVDVVVSDPKINDIKTFDEFYIQCRIEYKGVTIKEKAKIKTEAEIKEEAPMKEKVKPKEVRLELPVSINETFTSVAQRCRRLLLEKGLCTEENFPKDLQYSIRSPSLGDLDVSDSMASHNRKAEEFKIAAETKNLLYGDKNPNPPPRSCRSSDFSLLTFNFYPKLELVHEVRMRCL